MTARELLDIYLSFFEKRGHKRIENSSLVPQNDPTTLFTSSGMQPLVKYLLGEPYEGGLKRLVNVQNCFRAQDIDEVGDNRHTTFFRMLGNWSLGDYFKGEQIPWFWEFLVEELKLDPNRLYVSCFEGYKNIPKDEESASIWRELFTKKGVNPEGRIFYCGVNENWWSRSGTPDEMPSGEPGGPDTEVYFDFEPTKGKVQNLEQEVEAGRLLEIGNSVFMTYQKKNNEFVELEQKNVDFGGGLERLLAAVELKENIFDTSLLKPIIELIGSDKNARIACDHLVASVFLANDKVVPSNKEQGYILRRLIRRAVDNLKGEIEPVINKIVEQYKDTDPVLVENYEHIKGVILEEVGKYNHAVSEAKKFIEKKYKRVGDNLEISAEDAFNLYSSHGLSPTQVRSLGLVFDEQELAELIKKHQNISRIGGEKRFKKS
ncbi:MAG TPA: alanine--tRNA ligase-related protein [Patescibacteria group bacterium]|nr:alanine--tRNA ligase-related protein [Patescibacteria group bacterium]